MNKKSWLEIAEYISLVGSVVGSAAAVASQQLVYAAIPVSASLVLNVASRRRLEDEQPSASAITVVERQLSGDVQSLREKVQALPRESDFRAIQSALADLRGQLQNPTQNQVTVDGRGDPTPTLHQQISQVRSQFSQLQESLGEVQNRLNSLPAPPDVKSLESALGKLSEGFAQLQSKIAQLQDQVQKQVERPQTADLTPVFSQITQLEQRLSSLPPPSDVKGLESALRKLSEGFAQLQSKIAQLQDQVQKQVERPQTADLTPVLSQITQIEQRLSSLPPPSDVKGLESALGKLSEGFAQLQTKMAQIQEQVQKHVNHPQIADLTPIFSEITQLEQRLSSLQSPPTELLEQHLEELRKNFAAQTLAIASVRGETQNLAAKADLIPLAESVESLQRRQKQLEQAGVPLAPEVARLAEKLDAVNKQVNQLVDQISTLATLEQLEELKSEHKGQMQLTHLHAQRLEQLHSGPAPFDSTDVEEVLGKIAESVAEVIAETERRIAPLEAVSLNSIQNDLDSHRQAIASLTEQYTLFQESLASTRDRLNSLPDSAGGVSPPIQVKLESLESTITTAGETIAQLQEQVKSIQTTADLQQLNAALTNQFNNVEVPSLEEFEELKTALADLERSVNNQTTKTEVQRQLAEVQQLVTEVRETTSSAITELNLQLAEEVQALREQMQTLAPDIEENVTGELLRRLDTLSEEYQRRPERRQLTALREAYEDLAQRFDRLATRKEPDDGTAVHEISPAGVEEALRSLSAGVAELRVGLSTLDEQFQQRPEKLKLRVLREAIDQINQRLEQGTPGTEPVDLSVVEEEIADVTEQLDTLSEQFKQRFYPELVRLREAIDQINLRIDELATPPEPVEPGANEATLVLAMAGLAELRRQFDELPRQPEPVDVSGFEAKLAELSAGLGAVHHRIDELQVRPEQVDLRRVEEAMSAFQADVAKLREDLGTVGGADFEVIRQEVSQLQDSLASVTSRLESLPPAASPDRVEGLESALARLQTQIENLANQFSSGSQVSVQEHISLLTGQIDDLAKRGELTGVESDDARIHLPIAETVRRQLGEINEQLQALQTYQYELVFDRPAISAAVAEALESSRERLIIVCPWLSRKSINSNLLEKFEALLRRNVKIDIGWGHMRDIEAGEFPVRTNQQWQIGSMASSLYDALNELEGLKRKYPGRLRLKVLGTHENFLVCDRTFAMLASHHFLSTANDFPEREVGLRTTDPRIIQGLIERFNEPVLNTSNAEVYYNRGFERLGMGDYQGAVEDYTLSLQLNPNQPTAYNNRGLAKYHLKDFQGALEDYSSSLELNPNEAGVYFNRGVVRFNQGDYQGSVEDYTRAIALAPLGGTPGGGGTPPLQAYFSRGEAYVQLGDYQSAIEDYTQAIALAPTDAVAFNNRGLARYNLGDFQGAIADYTQALALSPEDAVACSNRGVARSSTGDYLRAIEDFDLALSLDPEYAGAYQNRGLARSQVGEHRAAIADLRKAAELFLTSGDMLNRQQALDALTKLESVT